MKTTYAITLKVVDKDDIEHEAFTYQNNRVGGRSYDFANPITLEQIQEVRTDVLEFIALVGNNCDPNSKKNRAPQTLEITEIAGIPAVEESEGVEAVEDVPPLIIFDYKVGSLVASMVYDKTAKTFTGEQSDFDIVWCDFMAYLAAMSDYLDVVIKRG